MHRWVAARSQPDVQSSVEPPITCDPAQTPGMNEGCGVGSGTAIAVLPSWNKCMPRRPEGMPPDERSRDKTAPLTGVDER